MLKLNGMTASLRVAEMLLTPGKRMIKTGFQEVGFSVLFSESWRIFGLAWDTFMIHTHVASFRIRTSNLQMAPRVVKSTSRSDCRTTPWRRKLWRRSWLAQFIDDESFVNQFN